MPKKTISPRITPRAQTFLKKYFETPTHGARYILDAMPILMAQSMAEIAGRFTRDELAVIISAFSPESPGLAPAAAGGQINRITNPAIKTKIEGLDLWQRVSLEIWAAGFHFDTMSYEKTLDKWADGLC